MNYGRQWIQDSCTFCSDSVLLPHAEPILLPNVCLVAFLLSILIQTKSSHYCTATVTYISGCQPVRDQEPHFGESHLALETKSGTCSRGSYCGLWNCLASWLGTEATPDHPWSTSGPLHCRHYLKRQLHP